LRRTALGFLITCLTLAGCATVGPEGAVVPVGVPAPPGNGKVEVGAPYFDFAAPTITGEEVRLSTLVGPKVVLLQFWGIRCAPCLAEFGFLADLQQRYGERGLQVIGVNTDRVNAQQLTQAMEVRKLTPPYPTVMDPDFGISKNYTNYLIPVSVLIDREGIVQAVHTGYKPKLDALIVGEVERLLER
jgi:peroxiredoxin